MSQRQLVNNQEEINCLDKIQYGKNSWTRLSLINDEIVHQSSTHKSLCILGFCVVPRKGSSTSRIQRSLEEQSCRSPIRRKAVEDYDVINGESTEFEWNIFPRIHNRCSFVIKSMIY